MRNWLREHGFAKLAEYGNTDLAYLLAQGRRALGARASGAPAPRMPVFAHGDAPAPAFYSVLAERVANLPMKSAPAKQWAATIAGMTKNGVKRYYSLDVRERIPRNAVTLIDYAAPPCAGVGSAPHNTHMKPHQKTCVVCRTLWTPKDRYQAARNQTCSQACKAVLLKTRAGARKKKPESFVYLLVLETKLRFKIGKALDIRARARGLGHRFDPTRSIGLRVASAQAAYDLESILHKSFKRWRIHPGVIREEDGHHASGFTEWFSLEGWDRVRTFLDENAELLGFVLVDPLTDAFAPTLRRPSPGASAGRARGTDPAADAAAFAACAARCLPLLVELVSLSDACEVIPTQHAGKLQGTARDCDKTETLLIKLMRESQYEVGWGGGSAFPTVKMHCGARVTFTLACNFYWQGFGDSRYVPLQDAFLALPLAIDGWKECAQKVNARDVFVLPRSAPRQWSLLPI